MQLQSDNATLPEMANSVAPKRDVVVTDDVTVRKCHLAISVTLANGYFYLLLLYTDGKYF